MCKKTRDNSGSEKLPWDRMLFRSLWGEFCCGFSSCNAFLTIPNCGIKLTDRRIDIENTMCIHSGVLREWNYALWIKKSWTADYSIEWNKPFTQKQMCTACWHSRHVSKLQEEWRGNHSNGRCWRHGTECGERGKRNKRLWWEGEYDPSRNACRYLKVNFTYGNENLFHVSNKSVNKWISTLTLQKRQYIPFLHGSIRETME